MKVGDYVRTKRGNIGKLIAYKDNSVSPFDIVLDCGAENDEEYVDKTSPNIIDLIEVGDYINGLPVRFVEENRIDIGQAEDYLWLKNEHIKSIVTKEQFSCMEYKIGE